MGDNPFEEPSTHNQRLLNTGGSRSYGGSGGYQPKEVFGDSYVEAEGSNDNYKPELQFQNFQHTSAQQPSGSNRISSTGQGAAVIHPDQSTVVDFEDQGTNPLAGAIGSGGGDGNPPPSGESAASPEPQPAGNARFWNVEYYRPWFNVDTIQVLERILRSLTPFRFGFIETAKSNPDFYGPFWISTTLIFLLAMAGNLHAVIAHYFPHFFSSKSNSSTQSPETSSEEWSNNFFVIVVGASVIYGYTIVIPLVLWGVFKYLNVPVRLLEIICIYGYTLFIFIPVSVICIVLNDLLQWILVLVTCAWSGFFLVSNLLVTVKDIALKRGLVAMLVVGALHMALGLTYKLYFFQYAYN